jgi:hypothetical protein
LPTTEIKEYHQIEERKKKCCFNIMLQKMKRIIEAGFTSFSLGIIFSPEPLFLVTLYEKNFDLSF